MKRHTAYHPSLFDQLPPVEKKPALVLDIKMARQARNEGMEKAVDHADDVEPGWSSRAYKFLLKFLQNHNGNFMGEEVRSYAALMDFELPPSNRAWGSVIAKAAKEGLIERVGYQQVRNVKAHRTPATLWRQIRKQVL